VDLVHQPLHTILEGTGHRSPDLGGSTASMLAALIGLSLIRMAVEVSLGNDEGSEGGATDALEQALATLDQQSVALADLADADQDAFQAYLAALKRRHQPPPGAATGRRAPAATDQARSRDDAVSSAETVATRMPVQAAHVVVQALELVVASADSIRSTVASDIFGGAALLHGALTGVLLAIDINLKSGQPRSRAALAADRDDLSWRGKAAFAEIKTRAEAAGYQL
jgi:formiminotetrahydrofolate cyclodeaminase